MSTYEHQITLPEATRLSVREHRPLLKGHIIVEEWGGDKITVYCVEHTDAVMLLLLFS